MSKSDMSDSDESSDDERETQKLTQKVKEQHKQLRIDKAVEKRNQKEQKLAEKLSAVIKKSKNSEPSGSTIQQPTFYELKDGEIFGQKQKDRQKNISLGHRLEMGEGDNDALVSRTSNNDGHQMNFNVSIEHIILEP